MRISAIESITSAPISPQFHPHSVHSLFVSRFHHGLTPDFRYISSVGLLDVGCKLSALAAIKVSKEPIGVPGLSSVPRILP